MRMTVYFILDARIREDILLIRKGLQHYCETVHRVQFGSCCG